MIRDMGGAELKPEEILDKLRKKRWVRFVNMNNEFPLIAKSLWKFPSICAYWRYRLWHFNWRGYCIILDFRLHPFRDMMNLPIERADANPPPERNR